MSDKQKLVLFFLALMCNFTFLATAQNAPTEEAKKLPECIRAYGKDSLETLQTMSVLQQDYKNKDYDYAYKWFSYMFTKAPCAYKSVYQYGQNILISLIADPKYIKRRSHLIDTLMMVFPTRIKYFGDEGLYKGKWAYYMSKYQPEKLSEVLKLYEFYLESEKDRIDDVSYIRDYMKQGTEAHKKALYSKEQLFTLYDKLSTLTENYKSKYATDTLQYKNWLNTGLILDKMMAPYLKCADIDLIYQPKLKAEPDNQVLISKVLRLYRNAGTACKDNVNYNALLEKSFALDPNAVAAEGLGQYFEKKKNFIKANQYYEKAAELSTDPKKKEELYIKLAKNSVKTNFTLAKSYADKALNLNPNNGMAIIIQGMAIYKSKCGDKFEQAMAACAAIDLFNKAKSLDPSCAAEANAQINTHMKYIPLKADAFFRGLKSGDNFTIPCSGISTTVRTR